MNTGTKDTADAKGAKARPAPNLVFSHMGLSVIDIDRMEAFYGGLLGFSVTDRGELPGGMKLVFMSRDPEIHHQVVLASGRPDNLPQNTVNPQFGPSINQISFRMGSLADLRDIHERLIEAGHGGLFPANHGIAWSIYAHDPEGNTLEFFVDTQWYFCQPFLIPLDFSKTDEEIYTLTEKFSREQEGFEPYTEWRARFAKKMARFVPAPAHSTHG